MLIGFLTGVGIQVALGQVSGMLGLAGGGHGTVQKIWNDLQQLQELNLYSAGIAAAVLVVIAGSKKISKKIPGALIAVIGMIVLSWALDLEQHVHLLGSVPGGLPRIGLRRRRKCQRWGERHHDVMEPRQRAMGHRRRAAPTDGRDLRCVHVAGHRP